MGFFAARRARKLAAQYAIYAQYEDQIRWQPAESVGPADREPVWEYLYFASEVARGIAAIEPDYAELVHLRVMSAKGPTDDVQTSIQHIKDAAASIGISVELLVKILQPARLELAMGAQGEPGNEQEIAKLAHGIVGAYANLIHIAHDLRSSRPDRRIHALTKDTADIVLLPLEQIRAWSSEVTRQIHELAEKVRSNTPVTEALRIVMTITMDPSVTAKFNRDIAAAQRLI
ncbi:MAG: hypothetical protein WCG62_03490 [Actinomycetes bacterium]